VTTIRGEEKGTPSTKSREAGRSDPDQILKGGSRDFCSKRLRIRPKQEQQLDSKEYKNRVVSKKMKKKGRRWTVGVEKVILKGTRRQV